MRLSILWLTCSLPAVVAAQSTLPRQLWFEENRGQASTAAARFRTTGGVIEAEIGDRAVRLGSPDGVRLVFSGARPDGQWKAEERVWTNHYFLGNDRAQWVPEVPVYRRLRRENLYPGIGVVLYGAGRDLEYDLILEPGADPAHVRLRFEGARNVEELPGGALRVESAAGEVFEQRVPAIYQLEGEERRAVKGRFVRRGSGEFGLELGEYDRARRLVVDPRLFSLSVVGGENEDEITHSGRVPNANQMFVAGHTRSVSFGRVRRRSRDIFVSVFDVSASGFQRVVGSSGFTSFFGGSGDDELGSVSPDSAGREWLIAGTTSSTDLPFARPTNPNGVYRGGATDGFWVRFMIPTIDFNLGGYVGGSGEDRVAGAQFDFSASIVVMGHTNSPDLPVRNAWQSRLAGGTDLFVIAIGSGVQPVVFGSYYGGSGDETARAITASGFLYWLGGETRSTDFPVTQGRTDLRGGSDGFLLSIRRVSQASGITDPPTSQLIGGSDEDSVTALHNATPPFFTASSPVCLAGTTRSSDFPVVNAPQASLGGGSDAFAGCWRPSDSTWTTLTYWGGSGDEEARGVWADTSLRIHLAGETRSANLPLVEPLQSTLAGPSDAFYLFLDANNRPLQSTYFGGAGDDAAYTVVVFADRSISMASSVLLGGVTNSPELPLPAETPAPNVPGGRNGFLAGIETNAILTPERVTAGKDLITYVGAESVYGRMTVRSARPDLIQPLTPEGNPVAETTLTETQGFRFEAYADSGEAELFLTAPGFPTRTVRVTLRPTYLVMQTLPAMMSVWSTPFSPRATLAAVNPETNRVETFASGLRTGLAPVEIEWVSSDPAVLRVERPTEGSPLGTTVSPVGLGTAELTIANPRFPVLSDNNRVEVVRPEVIPTASPIFIGRDLVASFTPTFRLPGPSGALLRPRGRITYRSADPTKLLLSTFSGEPGTESVTVDLERQSGVSLYALADSGATDLMVSAEEATPASIPVQFAGARLMLNRDAGEVRVAPTAREFSVEVTPTATVPLGPGNFPVGNGVRPGLGNASIRFSSTNPSVIEPLASAIPINSRSMQVRVVGEGEAELVAEASGVDLAPARIKVIVAPQPRVLSIQREVLVGKDLQTRVSGSVSPSFNGPGQVVVRVSNPEVARVSLGTEPGATEIAVPMQSSFFEFWVEGFASSGGTELTVEFMGTATARSAILAFPSAVTWTTPRVSAIVGDRSEVAITTHLLDDVTGEPLASWPPRVGVSVSGSVEASSGAIELSTNSFDLSRLSRIGIRALAPGEHTVRFRSSGPIPSIREVLRFGVARSRILASSVSVARDTAIGYRFSTTSNSRDSVFFTVTSLDPGRLLVSDSATTAGAASVRVRGPNVVLHALAGDGIARLSITAEDHVPAEADVSLIPLTVGLELSTIQGAPQIVNLRLPGQRNLSAALRWSYSPAPLRPGAAPIEINVASSDPGVFTVEPSRVTLTPGMSSAEFRLVATGPGMADLSLTSPSVTVRTPTVRVAVRRSSLAFPSTTIGTQQQLPAVVTLESGTENPRDGFILTVTSSDPSRLLVSRSPTTPGSASVSVAWQVGNSQSSQFFLQALEGEGDVNVVASGGVLDPGTGTIKIQRSYFRLERESSPSLQTGGGDTVGVRLGPSFASLRPGAPAVRVAVVTSNPDVVTVQPDVLVFREGESGQSVSVRARGPGRAVLTLQQPEGFAQPPQGASVSYTVTEAPLGLSCGVTRLARDGRLTCSISEATASGAVTITTSDSSKLLVSAQPNSPGVAELQLTAGSNRLFFVSGLGDSGTVTITATAPGFTTARETFTLAPSSFAFAGPAQVTVGTGQKVELLVQLVTVNQDGSRSFVSPRGGLNARVTFATSASGVARPDPAFVDFSQSSSPANVQVLGVAPGTATITLIQPPGYPAGPESTRTVVVR